MKLENARCPWLARLAWPAARAALPSLVGARVTPTHRQPRARSLSSLSLPFWRINSLASSLPAESVFQSGSHSAPQVFEFFFFFFFRTTRERGCSSCRLFFNLNLNFLIEWLRPPATTVLSRTARDSELDNLKRDPYDHCIFITASHPGKLCRIIYETPRNSC